MSYIDPWGFSEKDREELDIPEITVQEYKKGMYRVHMRIFDRGILHHRVIRTNDLGITVKIPDVGDFDIKTQWLFKEKKFFLWRLTDRLKGIKQNFITMYEVGNSDPFQFSLAYPKVSGGHLNTIKQSNALSDALKSWVQTKFDTRMLVIILAVMGMVGVYFLYSMGYIDLSSIIKR